jgi:hypothetical protein
VVGDGTEFEFVGAGPESMLLDKVKEAAQAKSSLIV